MQVNFDLMYAEPIWPSGRQPPWQNVERVYKFAGKLVYHIVTSLVAVFATIIVESLKWKFEIQHLIKFSWKFVALLAPVGYRPFLWDYSPFFYPIVYNYSFLQVSCVTIETSEWIAHNCYDLPLPCRCATVEEVASIVKFIVSKEASFNTAYCFDLTGGRATY